MARSISTMLLLLIGLTVIHPKTAYSQSIDSTKKMEYFEGQVIMDGRRLSLKETKQIAENVSMEAFENFKQAKAMSRWNAVFLLVGFWRVAEGAIQVKDHDNSSGYYEMAAGGVLLTIPFSQGRRTRKIVYLKLGVDAYNKAIETK